MSIPRSFSFFLLTGLFLLPIPIYVEIFLLEPETTYIISAGLGESYTYKMENSQNITLDFEISSDTNFIVIIDYCSFEDEEYFADSELAHQIIMGYYGANNIFALLVKDQEILSKINSSIANDNSTEPFFFKNFHFNCSLSNGTPQVTIFISAGYYSGLDFRSKLLISFTHYEYKIRNWVWFTSFVGICGLTALTIALFLRKKSKNSTP